VRRLGAHSVEAQSDEQVVEGGLGRGLFGELGAGAGVFELGDEAVDSRSWKSMSAASGR
jgi:hypothetical protein